MSKIEAKNLWKIYNGRVEAVKGINFSCDEGEFLAILGPSGCGKSSTLRMIAGLEEITRGDLFFDGEKVNDLSPQERNIALAFENYALYPPLTVFDNIAFPLEAKGVDRQEIKSKVKKVAEMVEVTDLLDRKPANLSGGQQQRVSLARALIRTPRVFLLDEPISHMDQRFRSILRARIRRIHDELDVTTIYVTHDQEEAVALADIIMLMNFGEIQQTGSVEELWNEPVNKFVAGFLGEPAMNFCTVKVKDPQRISLESRDNFFDFKIREMIDDDYVGEEVTAGIRPGKIELSLSEESGRLPVDLEIIEPVGERFIFTVNLQSTESKIVVSRDIGMKANEGDTLWLNFPQEEINLFDPESEKSLL